MAPFAPLFCASDAELERLGAQRVTADCSPGYPCRVSLAEAKIGEALILCNFEHLAEILPCCASHAIYVCSGAVQAVPSSGRGAIDLAAPHAFRQRFWSGSLYKGGRGDRGKNPLRNNRGLFQQNGNFIHSYPQRSTRLFRGKSAAWLMHSNACKLHNAVRWV